MVLFIIGIMLGGLLTAVGQSAENTNRLEARNKLREIEEALYGFALVQGRLPCPASGTSAGAEVFDTSGNINNGICFSQYGLLPNATLGLSGSVNNGVLEDPWGNPYRYSVSGIVPGGGISDRYTGIDGIDNIYLNAPTMVSGGPNVLRVCTISTCSTTPPDTIMTNITPAVILTMGKNWADIATASANEQENASGTTLPGSAYVVSNTRDFVLTGYSEENFDDMVIWISPHLLFSKLITAGQLPL